MEIPPPPPQSEIPDRATRKSPFTRGEGDGQVFHFQKWGMSYGTDDKGHAASLVLSVLLFFGLLLCLLIGWASDDKAYVLEIAKMIGSAFLIVAGIAVGKSIERRE